jgi:hypothetical protein
MERWWSLRELQGALEIRAVMEIESVVIILSSVPVPIPAFIIVITCLIHIRVGGGVRTVS